MTEEKPKGKPSGMAAVSPERKREIYAARSARRAALPPDQRPAIGFAAMPAEKVAELGAKGARTGTRSLSAERAGEMGRKGGKAAKRMQSLGPMAITALKVLRVTAAEYGVPEDHQSMQQADGVIAKAEGE